MFVVSPREATRAEVQLDDIRYVPTGRFVIGSGLVDSNLRRNPPDNRLYPNAEKDNRYPVAVRPDLKDQPFAKQSRWRLRHRLYPLLRPLAGRDERPLYHRRLYDETSARLHLRVGPGLTSGAESPCRDSPRHHRGLLSFAARDDSEITRHHARSSAVVAGYFLT